MTQFTAIVQGEREERVKRLIGTNVVPLKSLQKHYVVPLSGAEPILSFTLDDRQLTPEAREKLISALCEQWCMSSTQVEAWLDTVGYSIPVDDCLISLHETVTRL